MSTNIGSSSRIYNLSSQNAVQYNNGSWNSNVVLEMPNLSFEGRGFLEVYLSIVHAEVPNSMYLVNEYNNLLSINASSFSIPFGNYNAISLLNLLQSSFLTGLSITGSYSVPQNMYTFTSATPFTINSSSTCYKFLGFDNGTSYTGTSVTSVHVCNFLPIPRICFHCPFINE